MGIEPLPGVREWLERLKKEAEFAKTLSFSRGLADMGEGWRKEESLKVGR